MRALHLDKRISVFLGADQSQRWRENIMLVFFMAASRRKFFERKMAYAPANYAGKDNFYR